MLAKLSALISSKVAIAALGGALVVGGGATAAVVATGHVPSQLVVFSDASHTDNGAGGASTDSDASHGTTRTVAIQGTLTHYASGGSGTSGVTAVITVSGKAKPQDDDTSDNDSDTANNDNTSGENTQQDQQHSGGATSTVTDSTGDNNGDNNGDDTASPTRTTTTTTAPATCTLTSPFTVGIDANTKINGQAKSAGDLANDLGHTVEIQAAEDSSCRLLATKVTVAAATDNTKHVFVGTVGTVNTATSSFTLLPDRGMSGSNGNSNASADTTLTVTVSSGAAFRGAVKGLGDLKQGMNVGVIGTLSGATVSATDIMAQPSDQGDNGHGKSASSGVAGVISGVGSKTNSFTVNGESHRSVTVSVNSATTYAGSVTSFGDLKQGMSVVVEGTPQSDGSLLATSVAADSDSGD